MHNLGVKVLFTISSRLGRLRAGGAKGPGLFFIMPCIDTYKKVDLRTVSFDVPPQEVGSLLSHMLARAACVRCHGTKCPLLTAFFFFLSSSFLLPPALLFSKKGLS